MMWNFFGGSKVTQIDSRLHFCFMWVSLADKNLVKDYRKGFLSDEETPEAIIELLKQLTKKPYARKLSVVTSLTRLYLTTALSWDDNTKNYAVHINQRINAGKTVIVVLGNIEGSKKSVVTRQCSLDEAVEYVDLYVLGILLKKYGEL